MEDAKRTWRQFTSEDKAKAVKRLVMGGVFAYLGSAIGLSTTADWTAQCDQASASFGASVACAGDVNGDGYSDVIVGATKYDNTESNEGAAFLYYGNGEGGGGLALTPQLRRADNSAPIQLLDKVSTGVRIAALGRTPYGRGKVKLEIEVKPLGTDFDGTGTVVSAS